MNAALANDTTNPEPPAGAGSTSAAELWKRYHQDRETGTAEEELVRQYLPLVKTVVGRMAVALPPHVDAADLHSAGLVGLLNAIRQFDPSCGAAFETYARVRIRGAVFDELRRMDWMPRSVHAKARKVQAAMQQLEQEHGRVPTDAEVAKALGLTPAEYEQWLAEIRPATFVCLDAVSPDDRNEGGDPHDAIADPRQETPEALAHRRELSRLIAERLQELPEMQRKVLALYYFEDLRLREIAAAFHLTESRICQIHAQAILALKTYLMKQEAGAN